MTTYFYETNTGKNGYIDAETISEAREIFFAKHPDVSTDCAGIWSPEDPEYPNT